MVKDTKIETTEVIKTGENLAERVVAMKEQAMAMSATMADMGIEASDLVIPRLLLMQNTSEYVGDKKAQLGDVVNSQTMEVVGGEKKPLEIIPLKLYKTLKVFDQTQTPPKFIREEPLTPANSRLPYEGTENGIQVKRFVNMNLFVLLKKDLEKGEAFPCVVSFKSTSIPAGKQIATQLFKMASLGRLPYSQTVNITVSLQKKERNTFAVFGAAKGNNVDGGAVKEAEKWLSILASVQYRVDEREETENTEIPSPVVQPKVFKGTTAPPEDTY